MGSDRPGSTCPGAASRTSPSGARKIGDDMGFFKKAKEAAAAGSARAGMVHVQGAGPIDPARSAGRRPARSRRTTRSGSRSTASRSRTTPTWPASAGPRRQRRGRHDRHRPGARVEPADAKAALDGWVRGWASRWPSGSSSASSSATDRDRAMRTLQRLAAHVRRQPAASRVAGKPSSFFGQIGDIPNRMHEAADTSEIGLRMMRHSQLTNGEGLPPPPPSRASGRSGRT